MQTSYTITAKKYIYMFNRNFGGKQISYAQMAVLIATVLASVAILVITFVVVLVVIAITVVSLVVAVAITVAWLL